MNYLLPIAILLVGFRILVNPIIRSMKYQFVFDLTAYQYPLSLFFIFVGLVLLAETAGIGPWKKK